MSDLIDYLGIENGPIRVSHAVSSLVEPEQVEEHIETRGLDDHRIEVLKSQIKKRKQIMQGLHKEIRDLEEKLDDYLKGENS